MISITVPQFHNDKPPEDINEAPEDLEANFHILESYVYRNPALFSKKLMLLQKMLSGSQKKLFDLQ